MPNLCVDLFPSATYMARGRTGRYSKRCIRTISPTPMRSVSEIAFGRWPAIVFGWQLWRVAYICLRLANVGLVVTYHNWSVGQGAPHKPGFGLCGSFFKLSQQSAAAFASETDNWQLPLVTFVTSALRQITDKLLPISPPCLLEDFARSFILGKVLDIVRAGCGQIPVTSHQ